MTEFILNVKMEKIIFMKKSYNGIVITQENIQEVFEQLKERLDEPGSSPVQDRSIYTDKLSDAVAISEKYQCHSMHVENEGETIASEAIYLSFSKSNFTLQNEYFEKEKKFICFKLGDRPETSTIETGDIVYSKKTGIFIKKKEPVSDNILHSFNVWTFFSEHGNDGFLQNPPQRHIHAFSD